MKPAVLIPLVAVTVLTAGPSARAQQIFPATPGPERAPSAKAGMSASSASPHDTMEEVVVSYRLTLLTVDVAAMGLGLASQDVGTIFAGYAIGAPFAHLLHRNPRNALISLGLRLGLPVLGYRLVYKEDSDDLGLQGVQGIFGGMLVAMVVDWAMLGQKIEVREESSVAGFGSVTLTPSAVMVPGGATLGLSGSF